MKRSTHRILTTHVGSLIRPAPLLDAMRARQAARQKGEPEDAAGYDRVVAESVTELVRAQAAAGVDVPSDGECGKAISWSQYALERLSGFERRPFSGTANTFARGADRTRFADFYRELDARDGVATQSDSVCVGPIRYTGQAELARDIANFKEALAGVQVEDAFLPVAAPSSVIPDRKNEHYASDEACLEAIALAMRDEYRAIVAAGFNVQLDDARAAVTYDRMVPPATMDEYLRWLARQVEVINYALEGIPEDKVRYHVCWGSWPGPHTSDVPLAAIAREILKVRAGAYLIEGANPRHEHEWRVWESVKLPPGKILAPGVISHATNVVEHPELVAERLLRYASVVGAENLIASTDCGFAQGPFHRRVHPTIQWAKLEALAQGAAIASRSLFGRG